MNRRFLPNALAPVIAALCLVLQAAPVAAESNDVVISRNDSGYSVLVNALAANIHYTYEPASQCELKVACFIVNASIGMSGIDATAPGGCKVDRGNAQTPTAVTCPAGGAVSFKMARGGTWSAYAGGGGQHTGTPCSPERVIVRTGSGANSIDTWDGCREAVFCDAAPSAFSGVEADGFDEIRGNCSSVVRH